MKTSFHRVHSSAMSYPNTKIHIYMIIENPPKIHREDLNSQPLSRRQRGVNQLLPSRGDITKGRTTWVLQRNSVSLSPQIQFPQFWKEGRILIPLNPPNCREMSFSSGFHNNQFLSFAPQISRLNSSNLSREKSLFLLPSFPAKLGFSSSIVADMNFNFRCEAASISGSGAEYSEQLLDSKKKKKKLIAGIDQDELLDPMSLADPDSCFCEFNGVQIHHKIYHEEQEQEHIENTQSKTIGLPMILLHGFGASVFSWNRVLKPLARIAGSKVLAFDRPAFGLTSRLSLTGMSNTSNEDTTTPLNPYSMAFSVLATLYFINSLAAEKVILFGHSAGSLVAVNTYFEDPERVAALILVAPAIIAPLISPKPVKENQKEGAKQNQESSFSSNVQWNPFTKIGGILSKISTYVVRAIMVTLSAIMNVVRSLYKKALTAFLRSALAVVLVRLIIDKFGVAGVRNAWYDANQVTDHVLEGYTKPLRTKGWDKALVEFTLAMLTDSASESKPPPEQRLNEISCPVLIITGDKDRIVPSWNAERLSKAIPGACFEVIKNCGHLPHEEKVEEFVSVVQKFLQKVRGPPEEQFLEAAT